MDFLELMEEGDKLESSLTQRAKQVARFEEKFTGFVNLLANTSGYSRSKRRYLLEEAETTSDFPILFGTVLERSLIAKYTIAKPDWRNYVKTGIQNDFRLNNLIGLYGLQSNLSQVKERGEYKGDKLTDGKVTNQLFKYGRQFPLSWEAMINDDLGAFSDISDRLANAALRTEFFQATKLYIAAAGPNTALFGAPIVHPLDGSSVTNKGTLTFNATNLALTVALMRRQRDVDGEPIIFEGFELVVGPDLEIRALQALSPGSLIATGIPTGAVATQTSTNIVPQLNISLHVNPYQPIIDTSGNNAFTWYVFGKLANGPAVQMNFLRGHENPEIVQRKSDKISLAGSDVSPLEGDFETDTMRWRVRHILGGSAVDPRLAYAQVSNT